jgi:DNA topoisomerase III
MGNVLIVSEKPGVAANIAHAVGAHEKQDGFYSGNGFIVTFCFGHLITLSDCVDYDAEKYEHWSSDNFPFIPETFKYKVKDDKGIKKQFKIIGELMNRLDVEVIYNMCDADREGELIFFLVVKALGVSKPIKRIWINDHTPEDIKRGFLEMKDDSEYANKQNAAIARQIADWVIGINYTTVATVNYSRGKVLNLGRLVIGILKLVYDRNIEIKKFRPKTNFELKVQFKSTSSEIYAGTYIYNEKSLFEGREQLDAVLTGIELLSGKIISKDVELSRQGPKPLFSLTALQGHITKKYDGWSSSKVLKICQTLYEEKKCLTYPRTPSHYVEESLINKMEKVLSAVTKGTSFESSVIFSPKNKIFNSSKVESHSAITPTYAVPESLNSDERIVYEEVKNRFISHFMPAAEYEKTEIITQVGEHCFTTRGKILIVEGWLQLYKKGSGETEDDLTMLPNVKDNDDVTIDKCEVITKKTTAPSQYTEDTLLHAMLTCGNNVEDDFEYVLKGFMIGTEATRAEAISKVLKVGYIEKKGKSLYITDMGNKIVEQVPLGELLDVNYTGSLEKKLKDIELGVYSKEDFLAEINVLVVNAVNKMKAVKVEICKDRESLGDCPDCGHDVLENDRSFSCSNYSNGCKFGIWKSSNLLASFGMKTVSKALAKTLIANKETRLTLNYTKLIDIKLSKLEDKWSLLYDFPSDAETFDYLESVGTCPVCGKKVIENLYGFVCIDNVSKDNSSCSFFINKENKLLEKFEIKKLSKSVMKGLLNKNKVQIKVSPTFNVFAMLECIEDKWNVKFEFPSKEENLCLREVIGKCPECGKNVYEQSLSFTCEDYKKDDPGSCTFSLFKSDKWFARYKKNINKSIAKALLKSGSVEIKGLYSEKKDKLFDATVLLKKNGQYWNFEFKF